MEKYAGRIVRVQGKDSGFLPFVLPGPTPGLARDFKDVRRGDDLAIRASLWR